MNRREAAALLNYAATLDGRLTRGIADQQRAAQTIGRWAEALVDVPAHVTEVGWDAVHAVRRYYEQRGGDRSAQYRAVEPHDLLAAWTPHRAELMNRHTDPVPATDPSDVVAYRAELAGTRTAVATGRQAAHTYRSALNPGTQERLAALTAGVGTNPRGPGRIPAQAAEQLARYRPARAARETARAASGPDPLSVECHWCHARTGEPCRTGFRRKGKGRATRTTPHPSRIEAALAAHRRTSV